MLKVLVGWCGGLVQLLNPDQRLEEKSKGLGWLVGRFGFGWVWSVGWLVGRWLV